MRCVCHILVSALLIVLAGCTSRDRFSGDRLKDALVWDGGQLAYRTNPAPSAYRSLLSLRNDLTRMQKAGARESQVHLLPGGG
jgi:hypothetical protein